MKNNCVLTNPLSIFLDKPKEDFSRNDLLRIIQEKQIERLTFHYTALDGKLKELKIPISTKQDAEIVLTEGERADGSSLFKGLVDTEVSDLYIVPLYKSAFLNPFNPGSLDFICRYLNSRGEPAAYTPDNILSKAHNLIKKSTGFDLYALGELEFYLFYPEETKMYLLNKQSNYHSSATYSKTGKVLAEMLRNITQITGAVKYAHGEVGFIEKLESKNPEINGKTGEQLEIELLPTPIGETGDNLVIAKWLIRNIAYRNGMLATFAPKLEDGDAGNGMHVHVRLLKNGKNAIVNSDGTLSPEAMRVIGGLCHHASSLTSFGNTVASSYLRLVPNQEAPTRVSWSDSNRSAMIRVPLGWSKTNNLASIINPGKLDEQIIMDSMQTVELRTPDGSANTHLLLAGITLAVEWGLTNERAVGLAEKLYVKGNIFKDEKLLKELPVLPATCAESAEVLLKYRNYYERDSIFPNSIIDYQVKLLKGQNDENIHKKLAKLRGKTRKSFLKKIMHQDIHRN
ncbi:glutamine synthetase [bacterium]|nr:MAG: glutamine synthetase [bacterium]